MCRFAEPKLCLLVCLAMHAAAGAPAAMRVIETDPPVPAVLGRMQWFQMRISFTADREVMFSSDAFFHGKRLTGDPVSGARFQPAGTGETAIGFTFPGAKQVDLIKIYAWEKGTNAPVAEMSLPADLTWTGAAPRTIRPTPDWAREMEAQQKETARIVDSQPSSTWLESVAGMLIFAGVPAYLALQAVAFWRLCGGWLKAALLPVIPMLLIAMYTADAYSKESNLWPLVLILTSPLAALYLFAVLVLRRCAGDR